jgi:hypothetical protein
MLESIKGSVWEALAQELQNFDFVSLPDKNQFRKSIGQDFQSIVLNFSAYQEGIILDINLASRIEQVEVIANRFLPYSLSYQPESFTAVASKGKIGGKPHQKIWIEPKQDLVYVIDEIEMFLYRKGFEFLDNCLQLDFLHQAYNAKPTEPCLLAYNAIHRCFRGLVVAALSQADWEKLSTIYQKELLRYGATESMKTAFSDLAKFLKENSL